MPPKKKQNTSMSPQTAIVPCATEDTPQEGFEKVPKWISEAADVYNEKWITIDEVVAGAVERKLTVQEKRKFVDFHFLRSENATIAIVTSDGRFAIKRDFENKGRGDQGTIKERKEGMTSSGLLPTRSGLSLFEHPDLKRIEDYLAGHCASLAEGIEMLWNEDPQHENLEELLAYGRTAASTGGALPDTQRSSS